MKLTSAQLESCSQLSNALSSDSFQKDADHLGVILHGECGAGLTTCIGRALDKTNLGFLRINPLDAELSIQPFQWVAESIGLFGLKKIRGSIPASFTEMVDLLKIQIIVIEDFHDCLAVRNKHLDKVFRGLAELRRASPKLRYLVSINSNKLVLCKHLSGGDFAGWNIVTLNAMPFDEFKYFVREYIVRNHGNEIEAFSRLAVILQLYKCTDGRIGRLAMILNLAIRYLKRGIYSNNDCILKAIEQLKIPVRHE